MQIAKKIADLAEHAGTEVCLGWFDPSHKSPYTNKIIKQGSWSVRSKTLLNYKQMQRKKLKVYGLNLGRHFISINWGRSCWHFNIPSIHKNWHLLLYYIKDEPERGYTRKEIRQVLESRVYTKNVVAFR